MGCLACFKLNKVEDGNSLRGLRRMNESSSFTYNIKVSSVEFNIIKNGVGHWTGYFNALS